MPNPVEKAVDKVKDVVKPEHPKHPEHPEHPHQADFAVFTSAQHHPVLLDLSSVVAVEAQPEGCLVHLVSGHSLALSESYADVSAVLLDDEEDEEDAL